MARWKWSVRCNVLLALGGMAFGQEAGTPQQRAAEILKATGVRGGIVVHLGSGDGELTAALKANDSYQVQGLDAQAEDVATARKNIRAKNAYRPVSGLLID